MKKIETLFTGIGLFSVMIVTGVLIWDYIATPSYKQIEYPTNKYGAFLVSQHAIYTNDFETAAKYAKQIPDTNLKIIKDTVVLADFLNGDLSPENAKLLKDETSTTSQFIYDAYLVKQNDWQSLYKRHSGENSSLTAPIRIWSGIATGKTKETLKFIDKLKTNDAWKHFVRGQIYAESKDVINASAEFEKVPVNFININDYLYLMSFYKEYKLDTAAQKLHKSFTENAGGMFMADMEMPLNWASYSGYNNQLAFSLIQNVSHTQIMVYSDLSLLMLRFAQIIQDKPDTNTLNYYIGQYFFYNGGNYERYFDKIDKVSPLYPFSLMKIVEKSDDINTLESAVKANPLFVPAITKLVAKNIQSGSKNHALRIVNNALDNKNLTESGRGFFLKTRAGIYIAFGDLDNAQKDITDAANISKNDSDILAKQSRIWVMQGRELNTAYDYAIALVRKNPVNVEYWDLLSMAVLAKEGPDAALEVLERVGQVAENCSILFEHLGDLYVQTGNYKLARESYTRAIDLSNDGLTVVPLLERKLRKVK